MTRAWRFWLVKSEPEVLSIQALARAPRKRTTWEGVRNYQARNSLREMRPGDGVLYHHSNADPSGIAGLARVVKAAYPDPTALDPRSEYYDLKATPESPRWWMVDLGHVATFDSLLTLEQLRRVPALKKMLLLQRGNRLSVMPVAAPEWKAVLRLAGIREENSHPARQRGS